MHNFFQKNTKAIIGMIHCLPLPGTVKFNGDLQKVRDQALNDAHTLAMAGVHAIMIENMGDEPYGITMQLEQVTSMCAIAELIKNSVDLPLGIDCAFSDYRSALAIAKAVGADFVRIPVYVDTVIFSDGIAYPCAHDAQLYRKKIGAEDVLIMADLQVKHTYMLSDKISLIDSYHLAVSNGADAVIVTGKVTGSATSTNELKAIKDIAQVPVYVGSGVNKNNIMEQLAIADGVIVGSSLKPHGDVSLPVELKLTKELLSAAFAEKGE